MNFDVIISKNKYSRIVFIFNITGKTNDVSYIDVNVSAKSQIKVFRTPDIISETFYEYFMKNVYPLFSKNNHHEIKEIVHEMEQELKKLIFAKKIKTA